MNVSERTLKQWRTDSLHGLSLIAKNITPAELTKREKQLHERILRLTQELMDLKLIMKG